jgi:eukaryotic-like serine/threonine-protein kinase
MIELRTLGGIDLRDASGASLDDLLRQPKRVALLIYLVLAEPQGFHRRDTIIGLLWPDLDAMRARAALRKSLHVLRGALGPDVVLTRGDEEVGVDPLRVHCDARAFTEAVAQGRVRDGLELYRGDLLDGFFVSEVSPDWEKWLEVRRTALRRRAVEAAWKQSADLAAAGEVAEAVRWARWASDRAPDDESGIRRLLDLLERLGDRAGVMRVYQEFRDRLRAEHDVEPDPKTQAQVAASGSRTLPRPSERPATAAGAAARPAGGPIAPGTAAERVVTAVESRTTQPTAETRPVARVRRWRRAWPAAAIIVVGAAVAVVALRGRGAAALDPDRLAIAPLAVFDTSLAPWGIAAEEFVSRSLDQAGSLRIVPPSVVARVWSGPVDIASASRFGRATGAGLVLIGSLLGPSQDSLRVSATLVDARLGEPLGDIEVRGSRVRVGGVMDSLAVEIVRTLAAAGRVVPGPHSHLSARSIPALKAFLDGEMALRRGSFDSAQSAFREAVRLDSTFAVAWLRLGLCALYLDPNAGDVWQRLLLRAGRYPGGLSRHDSMEVAVVAGIATSMESGVPPDSMPAFVGRVYATAIALTRDYPKDAESWYVLGLVRNLLFPMLTVSWKDVADAFAQAAALDSTFVPGYWEAVQSTFALGDTLGGLRLARSALAIKLPAATRAVPQLIVSLFDPAVPPDRWGYLLDSAPEPALWPAALALWLVPDSAERAVALARALARRPPDPRHSTSSADIAPRNVAAMLAYRGHLREALALIGTDDHWWFSNLLPDLAMLGAVPPAVADSATRAWLDGPPARHSDGRPWSWWWWAARGDTAAIEKAVKRHVGRGVGEAEAALALARRDTAAAVRAFAAWRIPWPTNPWGTIAAIRLLEATGQGRAALAVSQRNLSFLDNWPLPSRPVLRLERARLEERFGEPAEARDDYAFVAAVWRNADPELAGFVAEARAGLARVAGRGR